MTASTHGDQQILGTGEPEGSTYICDAGATRYERGMAINRSVPHLAMLVVTDIIRPYEFTPKGCL
jgi:hypothetical protein